MGARKLLADLAGAGVTVTADGGRLVIRPASKLTDAMRAELRDLKPAVLALLTATRQPDVHVLLELGSVAWNDKDIARFLELQARLIWWRWAEPDAEYMAERLVRRDREQDDRVSCVECRHFRPGRCGNYRRAGLSTSEVGHDMAGLLQRCAGFQAAQPV